MKKILYTIAFIVLAVSVNSQTKLYALRYNTNGTIDSIQHKLFTDSLFFNGDFVSHTKEYYDQFYDPAFPIGFGNYTQRADNIWINLPQQFESGEYTPTLFNTSNITASTPFVCNYFRIGNKVIVSGAVSIDADLAASTELQMSLPIASNFTSTADLGGNGSVLSQSVSNLSLGARANAANDRASFIFLATSLSNNTYTFTFSYTIK